MTRDLPPFLIDLLNGCPRAGDGVHKWLFDVCRQLHAHLNTREMFECIKERVRNCGRSVTDGEIWSAIKNSAECAWRPDGNYGMTKTVAKWPDLDEERRATILRRGNGLVTLWEESRVRIESNESKTESIIDALFPGNPLLCCGKSNCHFETKPREEWRGQLSQLQFIVPSPMIAPTGLTKSGKQSAHALSNTGPRRYLVCEFDQGGVDDHAALILHLGSKAPLVCVVHSGGKSLHAWFYVRGHDEEKIRNFFSYAVSLGADPATWTRSQFVRMPDGQRDTGNRQTVFFLNYRVFENERARGWESKK
jgi:hypothetical protein